jgi:hypothetical protein
MTCATCKHASPWKDTGFMMCWYLPVWVYRAGRMACAFEPSRWEGA